MELAERALLRGAVAIGVELEGTLPSELGHVLQPDIALSASLACCVCSGSAYNALHAWAGRRPLAAADTLHVWQLPSGRALPSIEMPSDSTGVCTPVVRAHGAILYAAAAGAQTIGAYAFDGCGAAPRVAFELRGHEGAVKSISVDDVLAASGARARRRPAGIRARAPHERARPPPTRRRAAQAQRMARRACGTSAAARRGACSCTPVLSSRCNSSAGGSSASICTWARAGGAARRFGMCMAGRASPFGMAGRALARRRRRCACRVTCSSACTTRSPPASRNSFATRGRSVRSARRSLSRPPTPSQRPRPTASSTTTSTRSPTAGTSRRGVSWTAPSSASSARTRGRSRPSRS